MGAVALRAVRALSEAMKLTPASPLHGRMAFRVLTALVLAATLGARAQETAPARAPSRWWMDEPVRFIQTNLPENYSTLDARRLIAQVADFPANVLLCNMGGIVAQYPTQVPFHYASPFLPPGRDLFGDVLREAHARHIRVVGRFDLSKTQKAVYDAHPEWFFKRTDGGPAIYNGLYSACINGGYYREHAPKILAEALERYPVDADHHAAGRHRAGGAPPAGRLPPGPELPRPALRPTLARPGPCRRGHRHGKEGDGGAAASAQRGHPGALAHPSAARKREGAAPPQRQEAPDSRRRCGPADREW